MGQSRYVTTTKILNIFKKETKKEKKQDKKAHTNPRPGSPPQKGIVTYGLAQNRQRALAGTAHSAVFNTARRTRAQILYWAIPILIGYETMQWAIER